MIIQAVKTENKTINKGNVEKRGSMRLDKDSLAQGFSQKCGRMEPEALA